MEGAERFFCIAGGPTFTSVTVDRRELELLIAGTEFDEPTGAVAAIRGETLRFEAWSRNQASGATASNFTDAEDRPVACYALVGDGEGLQLEHVWVAPAHIGRGLGRALVEHAAATAAQLGGAWLLIDSDPNAAAFYERMGAEPAGSIRADVCGERRELPRYRLALTRRR